MEKQQYQPSVAELEILNLIWALEPVTVREVYERIAAARPVGYTTVLKQIQRLTEKGILEKQIKEGAHYFTATLPASEVKKRLMDKVLRTAFGGSALDMMMHALGRDKIPPDELNAIKAWLDNQL
ncbi:MAG: BlaI/MecI/CopY family transcriptional regulator [Saprospirales bacterium]|nr:BlaI/MecI/CopY family transcriptional regulator [Saprospirales bacterium]MBK8920471.1 BlaI/MecI/CopY family transcriptional regulator [Saprospirales bacterium]